MSNSISSFYRNILQEQGIVDKNDTINSNILDKSFDLHIGLREDNNYETYSLAQAKRLINLFTNTYAGVKLRPSILRKKSPKSIRGKTKGLAIEHISKLACVKADIPSEVEELERKKYGEVKPLNLELFYSLFAERINENAEEPQNSYLKNGIRDLLYADIDENGNTVSSLGIIDKFNFNYYEDLLLSDGNTLSKSSRTALARMFYAKIKGSKLNEKIKQTLILELHAKYGSLKQESRRALLEQATSLGLNSIPNHMTKTDILGFDSIQRLENPESDYDPNKKQYDHRYSSPLERLTDKEEFLRCKDLIGMQFVIDDIPNGFRIQGNDLFNQLIEMRDSIQDKDSSEFRSLDQQCMTELSKDFMDKLRIRSTSWLESTNSRIINSSEKHKDKPNGYIADHIKFELQQNPLYALELHVNSKYVEDISSENGSASHMIRPGKKRKFHEILLSDVPLEEYPFSQIINCFIDTIDSLPLYMEFEPATNQFKKYSIMQSLSKYHGFSFENDSLKKKRVANFLQFFYRDSRSKDLIKFLLPSYYTTIDKIGADNHDFSDSPASHFNQDGPDL